MEDILSKLATTGLGLAILGGSYLLDLIIGSIKVWFSADKKWSFKKAAEDFLKALMLALGIECWVVLWEGLSWYCSECGIDITTLADGFSTSGMIAAIIGGSIWYLKNVASNAIEFVNTKHVDVTVGDIDYKKIADETISIFFPDGTKEAADAQIEAENDEKGGLGTYYSVPYDTYDNFRAAVIGKAFDIDGSYGAQCVTAGHFVSMADGTYKDVSELAVGDRVFSHDGEQINTIIRILKQKKPILQYNTSSNSVICTEDHKIFRENGEKCTIQDLKIPSLLGKKKRYDSVEFPVAHFEYDHNLTDDELRWLGFYLGDGTKKYRWSKSTKPEAFVTVGVQKKYDYLESLDIDQIIRRHSNGKARTYNLVNQSHKALCDIINSINGKELPKEFNAREYALIIEGYVAADGYEKQDGYYVVTSICKPLLLSIQYGCMLNNWHAKIGKENNRGCVEILGKKCNTKPFYKLTIRKDKEFSHYFQSNSAVLGEREVYVITTDGDHSYIVDNNGVQNCYDGAGLLWQQLGRWLSTGGGGGAKHCWTLARDTNAGSDFNLVTNLTDVKRGDVVVFGNGTYGHIGFADADYTGGAYISTLGQNQGGANGAFNVINCGTASFLGAFRLKAWASSTKTEEKTTTPTTTTSGFVVGDIVVPTKLVDYYGKALKQYDDQYTITQIVGDRAVLCADRNGTQVCWAAMNTSNIKKK